MAKTEIAFECGLKARVGCQDRLCANSDANETLGEWKSKYKRDVLPHSSEKVYAPNLLCIQEAKGTINCHFQFVN